MTVGELVAKLYTEAGNATHDRRIWKYEVWVGGDTGDWDYPITKIEVDHEKQEVVLS